MTRSAPSPPDALTELGYTTTLVGNAADALAELTRDARRFDVVFSDVVMPGISGIDLAREIRRRYFDLPVVLTSGYSHVLAQNGTYGFELLSEAVFDRAIGPRAQQGWPMAKRQARCCGIAPDGALDLLAKSAM